MYSHWYVHVTKLSYVKRHLCNIDVETYRALYRSVDTIDLCHSSGTYFTLVTFTLPYCCQVAFSVHTINVIVAVNMLPYSEKVYQAA